MTPMIPQCGAAMHSSDAQQVSHAAEPMGHPLSYLHLSASMITSINSLNAAAALSKSQQTSNISLATSDWSSQLELVNEDQSEDTQDQEVQGSEDLPDHELYYAIAIQQWQLQLEETLATMRIPNIRTFTSVSNDEIAFHHGVRLDDGYYSNIDQDNHTGTCNEVTITDEETDLGASVVRETRELLALLQEEQ
jgi:hypothetical protein